MLRSLSILFIEDDVVESMKIDRVIKKLDLPHILQKAVNGEEALEILNKKVNLPDIILLDLNMPKMNGIEFLSILKKDEALRHIPTIILTTSNNQRDLLECYKIGVSGYVIKPLKYDEYINKIEKVLSYWAVNNLIES